MLLRNQLIYFLQAKSIVQAEIDAAPELIDFFRFNAYYALELQNQQPINPDSDIVNTVEYRGLEVSYFVRHSDVCYYFN